MDYLKTLSNSKFTFINYTILFLCLSLIISCESEDEAPPDATPNYIVDGKLFDCNSTSTTFADIDFQVNHFYEFSNYLFFGGFEDFKIVDAENLEVAYSNEFWVSGFVEYNNKLILCSEREGIYEIDSDLNLMQKSDTRCLDIMLTSNNELLFLSADGDYLPNRIYELEPNLGILPYSEVLPSDMCIDVLKMVETVNGDIWAVTCGNNLLKIRDKVVIDQFNESNSPLSGTILRRSVHLVAYMDELIFINKNALPYHIFKYKNDEWITLLELDAFNNDSEQNTQMSLPSIVEAKVVGDKLYLSTTLAGCRGFHVFDLSKDELLQPEDYYVAMDPQFTNQCIDAFEVLPDGNIFVVTNEELTTYDCN